VLIADDPQLFAALAALVHDARLYLGGRAAREPPADAGRGATSATMAVYVGYVDLYLHQQAVDTSTPAGRALFQMLGVFAEFEEP
jgi:hypothetical protein